MLKVSLFELLFRGIPEAFLYIYASFCFTSKKFDSFKLFISSILLSVITYGIRFLPVHFGVHTILFVTMFIIINTYINKINLKSSISAAFILTIALFTSEAINVFFLINVLNVNIAVSFEDPYIKIMYGIPSIIMFAVFICIINLFIKKKQRV
jgi:hypothetical protein